jgi:hypothetical protein
MMKKRKRQGWWDTQASSQTAAWTQAGILGFLSLSNGVRIARGEADGLWLVVLVVFVVVTLVGAVFSVVTALWFRRTTPPAQRDERDWPFSNER